MATTRWQLGPLGGTLTDVRNRGINIRDADGWDIFGEKRAANHRVAYNDGAFSDPRKWFNEKTLALKFILFDESAGGLVTHPEGIDGHLRENTDLLLGLLNERNNHLAVRKRVPAPATVGGWHWREAVAEVIAAAPVEEGAGAAPVREIIVLFELLEGFWRQIEDTGAAAPRKSVGVTGVTTTSQGFNIVTGGNAPIRGGYAGAFEVEFTANSAITDPRLEVDATGEYIQYSGALTAGETITFDIGRKTLVIDDAGTLARADSGRSTQHAWWLDLDPASTIAVTASVQAVSDFDCEVRWYDRWH